MSAGRQQTVVVVQSILNPAFESDERSARATHTDAGGSQAPAAPHELTFESEQLDAAQSESFEVSPRATELAKQERQKSPGPPTLAGFVRKT